MCAREMTAVWCAYELTPWELNAVSRHAACPSLPHEERLQYNGSSGPKLGVCSGGERRQVNTTLKQPNFTRAWQKTCRERSVRSMKVMRQKISCKTRCNYGPVSNVTVTQSQAQTYGINCGTNDQTKIHRVRQ
jgi:hypothetical protein